MSRRILDDRIELEDFVFDSLDALDSMTFKLEAGDYEAQCLNSSYGATYVLAVAGINQQTGNTELAPFVSNNFDYEYGNSDEGAGSQLVKNWPDGYYKIEIRQYLTSGGTALSHIVGPGEYTNCHTKPMYWNKSPLRCMTYIAPGSFMMGSPVGEYGRVTTGSQAELLHKVTLSKAMYVQRTQLTTKEFGLLMAKIDGSVIHRHSGGYIGDDTLTAANYYNTTSSTLTVSHMPMQYLSWQDIMWDPDAYGDGYPYDITNSYYHTNGKCLISRLNSGAVSGFSVEGFTWNLPTEAQWEYAARAGVGTALPSGQNLNYPTSLETGGSDDTLQANLNRVGWYKGNANVPKTVGLKMPNRWGLFDVVGNLWEWCQDLSGASYPKTPVENPANLNYTSTGSRVLRGGRYGGTARNCRCGHRYSGGGSVRYNSCGSRLFLLQL
jgi:formylglycine-generating enzyme required for sulfatase activity